MTDRPAFVLLEDGAWFAGTTGRPIDPAFGEVVFTTNLTGYQETFTDPSYLGQIVVMTAPMIGNYGVNAEDMESDRPQVTGVVVRELSRHASNWRATTSLDEWLTPRRRTGDRGCRYPPTHPSPPGARRDARRHRRGTRAEPRAHRAAARLAVDGRAGSRVARRRARAWSEGEGPHVVAYDFGMKRNIVRMLVACRLPGHRGPAETLAPRRCAS